jgi:signal transduction histidine kinase
MTTALLATGSLALSARLLDQPLLQGPMLLYSGMYLAIAVSMTQAKRILAEGQASVLVSRIQAQNDARILRLREAHGHLTDLSRLAEASELNPITAGHTALSAVSNVVTVDAALVALAGPDGPLVVARQGDETVRHHRQVFPLEVGDRDVGFFVVSRERALDDQERALIEETLRPLALVFANILLLRDIARRAVKEERVRLARELHDEIGPSLASLGLALDLTALQYPANADLAGHLQDLRQSVTGLVEDVRNTVADLRQPDSESLVDRAEALAAEAGPNDPTVLVAIDERRPPRPRIVDDLFAVLTESVRNAIDHSGATVIRIEGFVNGAEGKLVVADDGRGFDPYSDHPGHYGLIGIRERARSIGAALNIESNPGTGTQISLEWDAR